MERKIGEVFEWDGVKLRVEQESQACKGCYFHQLKQWCDGNRSVRGECQSASRSDGGVIFRKVEDVESRTVKLTLEKAKEFYKKGGRVHTYVRRRSHLQQPFRTSQATTHT